MSFVLNLWIDTGLPERWRFPALSFSKNHFGLFVGCFLVTTGLASQEVHRKLIYSVPPGREIPDLINHQRSDLNYPLSPDFSGKNMFSVNETRGQYRVFYNGDDLGVFPAEPEFSWNGDLLLIEKLEGKNYVRVNGVRHGPFHSIQSREVTNGHVVIVHVDGSTRTSYLYVDSVDIASKKSTFFDWGPGPGVWQEGQSVFSRKNIYTADTLLCADCNMYVYGASGNHYYFVYRYKQEQAEKYYYILDGGKPVLIDGYWSPKIDSLGNFFLPCQKNGRDYVQTSTTLFGPIKNQETVRHSFGKFGLLFKFQKPEEPKNTHYLYNNGAVYGPWDSLTVFTGSDVYYYEKNGARFLGKDGRSIFRFEGKNTLQNIAYNTSGQYLFECRDSSIYFNDTLLGKFPSVLEMWINEKGDYFILFEKKRGTLTASVNGRLTGFEAPELFPYSASGYCPDLPGFIRLSEDCQHFLLYLPQSDFFIVDGKKYPCIPEKTTFYYIKSINSFCWLTVESRDIYWHTLHLN